MGMWTLGGGRRKAGVPTELPSSQTMREDRQTDGVRDRKRQGPRQIGTRTEVYREMCSKEACGVGGPRLGLGYPCAVSEVEPQVGKAGGHTWAMRWFRPSLSWARLSFRALSLDKESRREASSTLSLVMDSSSSTRPASACRVGTRAARDGSIREGERPRVTRKDAQTWRDKEKWGEKQRGGVQGAGG